jgi:predicted hydrocarbon binding protein
MEEVMGAKGIEPVIHQTSIQLTPQGVFPNDPNFRISFIDLSRIQQSLIEGYGARGGRGLAQLSGQASLRYGLRELGGPLGLNTLDFRLMPLQKRVRLGLNKLAEAFSEQSDQIITLSEDKNSYLWQVRNCPHCWQQQAEEPICNVTSGLLHEYLSWLSGGHYYHVVEIACTACGASECVHRIDKKPIE